MKSRRPAILGALLIALAIVPSLAFAQASACPDPPAPCEAKAGQSISLSFTHSGTNVQGFRIYLASEGGTPAKVGNDIALSAIQNGGVLIPLTAPSVQGAYALTASAYNAAGETSSPPYEFSVLVPPVPPGNLKLYLSITVAQDGTVQFRVVDTVPGVR
jgi:hypothetical protein